MLNGNLVTTVYGGVCFLSVLTGQAWIYTYTASKGEEEGHLSLNYTLLSVTQSWVLLSPLRETRFHLPERQDFTCEAREERK